MRPRLLIALADPNWIGHRETYFREFVLSLLRIGVDVVALCPNPERLEAALALARAQEDPDENAPQVFTARLTEPSRLKLVSKFPHDPVTTVRRWRRTANAMKEAEAKAGRKVDFLFLPWLDSYLRASLTHRIALAGIHCPWSGLYFRPYHLVEDGTEQALPFANPFQRAAKGDDLLRASSCMAVSVLDETLRPALEVNSHKPVVLFPDITDESPPNFEDPFARKIREVANGRKVIGLIGLERRKGVTTLLQAADKALAERKPWLFVLSGLVRLDEYTDEEQRLFKDHLERSRRGDGSSNVLFQDELSPIPDGPAFNGVMSSFDVLYTAYHDFQGSSNVLTKAAILQKPVVSTDYGCIGSRTKSYDLGLVIPQGDAAACCNAIEKLLAGKSWNDQPLKPRYSEYHSKHNRSRLDVAMSELLKFIPLAAQAVHENFGTLI